VVQNLIVNGGFETGDLSPWSTYGAAATEVVTTCAGARIAENPAEGTYCLHVTVPAAGANFWDMGLQRQDLVFQEGRKYTLSAFFKCQAGSVKVNFKPQLGADPWTGYGDQTITIHETWAEYHVTTPVFSSDAASAGIVFHIGFAAAEFWVDDIKWYEGDYVPTPVESDPGDETAVQFADPALKAAVEACLGIADPTSSDMRNLDWVNLTNRSITDLTGLEYARNLVGVDLSGNTIVDLWPLTGLTNLHTLALHGDPLSAKACLTDIPEIRANSPGVTIYYDGWPEQHTLAISSSSGGSVVMPSEGLLTVNYGECIPVEGVAAAGYQFTRWSGTAVDAGRVLDPLASHTSVIVEGDYSLLAHFEPQNQPWSVVYFNDFEGQIGPEWSHIITDATPVGGRRFLGQFGNDAVTLALTDLPPRTKVRLTFDLFLLRSWDGDGMPAPPDLSAGPGPDLWSLTANGQAGLLSTTFDNHWLPTRQSFHRQSYPYDYPGPGVLPETGAAEASTLGYARTFSETGTEQVEMDSVYHLTFTVSDSTPVIVFAFAGSGLQAITDESWGLDNVRVEVLNADVALTASSTAGGSVVLPGEGTFPCTYGGLAPVEAVAQEGYQFAYWSGTAVDANAMLDPCAPHTSVSMNADYSLVAHFKPQDQPWSTVYFNDFEGQVGPEWSRDIVDTTPIGARGFLGQFNSETVSLTLAGLPSHASIRLTFDLFLIRSWDGDGLPAPPGVREGAGPDMWSLGVQDGPTLLRTTFDNHMMQPYLGFHRQSYPREYPSAESLPETGAAEGGTLGYVWTFPEGTPPCDSVYHLSYQLSHAGDGIQLIFSGSLTSAINDESWGLDNVRVEVLAPEPKATLTVSSTAGGSIYVETMSGNVMTPWYDQPVPPLDHGTQVTVVATPDGGWKFRCWGGTMGSTESTLTFELTEDCHLLAEFVPE
jgi:hypothetical protein